MDWGIAVIRFAEGFVAGAIVRAADSAWRLCRANAMGRHIHTPGFFVGLAVAALVAYLLFERALGPSRAEGGILIFVGTIVGLATVDAVVGLLWEKRR